MTKIFFTSDTHFNDNRFQIFERPFKNLEEQHKHLIENWNSRVGKDDLVWHLGDFSVDEDGYKFVKELNGNINLILGNYDEKNLKDFSIFNKVLENGFINISGKAYYMTHKPEDASQKHPNIVGHIHGTWKVQKHPIMINVGCDAHHFYPVDLDYITFQYNGIKNYYDVNVFPYELFYKKNIDIEF